MDTFSAGRVAVAKARLMLSAIAFDFSCSSRTFSILLQTCGGGTIGCSFMGGLEIGTSTIVVMVSSHEPDWERDLRRVNFTVFGFLFIDNVFLCWRKVYRGKCLSSEGDKLAVLTVLLYQTPSIYRRLQFFRPISISWIIFSHAGKGRQVIEPLPFCDGCTGFFRRWSFLRRSGRRRREQKWDRSQSRSLPLAR